jgi:hypothetical protein
VPLGNKKPTTRAPGTTHSALRTSSALAFRTPHSPFPIPHFAASRSPRLPVSQSPQPGPLLLLTHAVIYGILMSKTPRPPWLRPVLALWHLDSFQLTPPRLRFGLPAMTRDSMATLVPGLSHLRNFMSFATFVVQVQHKAQPNAQMRNARERAPTPDLQPLKAFASRTRAVHDSSIARFPKFNYFSRKSTRNCAIKARPLSQCAPSSGCRTLLFRKPPIDDFLRETKTIFQDRASALRLR